MQVTFWVLLAIFVAISWAADPTNVEELKALHEKTHKECITQSHVSPQVLSAARSFNFDDNNKELKEHIYCYCKNLHLVDENDDIDLDTTTKFLLILFDQDFINSKLPNCLSIKRQVKKEEIYDTFKCAIVALKSLW